MLKREMDMKRFGLLLSFLAIAILSGAQTRDAQIAFDNEVHNFGTIKEEAGKVKHRFTFINTGASPLLIQDVKATCGCTAPSWSKEPIPAGGKGYVEAIFDPKGRPNAFTKYLYVMANTVPASTKLTISGTVTPRPRTIEDEYRYVFGGLRLKANHLAFGNVPNTGTKKFSLEVVNTSDAPVELGFMKVPTHLKIEFSPAKLKPGEKGLIKASYDASKKSDWGMVIDRLQVTVNGESERNYRLVVSANITEDFSAMSAEQMANAPKAVVDKPEVNFGKLKQTDKFEHEFVLTNEGKSTLFIRKIKSSCGCTAVQPEKKQIKPGESVAIKTIFTAAGKRGNQNKNVTIITNDPKRSNLILRIKGEVEVS